MAEMSGGHTGSRIKAWLFRSVKAGVSFPTSRSSTMFTIFKTLSLLVAALSLNDVAALPTKRQAIDGGSTFGSIQC